MQKANSLAFDRYPPFRAAVHILSTQDLTLFLKNVTVVHMSAPPNFILRGSCRRLINTPYHSFAELLNKVGLAWEYPQNVAEITGILGNTRAHLAVIPFASVRGSLPVFNHRLGQGEHFIIAFLVKYAPDADIIASTQIQHDISTATFRSSLPTL